MPPRSGAERVRDSISNAEEIGWSEPDLAVLRLHRRPAPPLPVAVLGPSWATWVANAAEAAACPVDYVVAPLLASASALIGNARWPQATAGWSEPPHLWLGSVGDSGAGKSPGADCLMRSVLPQIEAKMAEEFPDELREWRAAAEVQAAKIETWKAEVRTAAKAGKAPPLAPLALDVTEPQQPRLRQNDTTIEKLAELLATAAPKGLLLIRDELAGWIGGMNAYNDAGRSFWVEAYGGRPYRVERKKHPEPIVVQRLAIAVHGGTQPDKLAALMRDADDGLLSRFLWCWPEPILFKLGETPPQAPWAIGALEKLRELDLHRQGETPEPLMVLLSAEAGPLLVTFAQEMQERQVAAGGLLCSAYGKARGHALRLALVLEFLWWCGEDGIASPPTDISVRAVTAAAHLLTDYFAPMAERVYGDAAIPPADRNATTLARWIRSERPEEVYVRRVQRVVRLPRLTTAEAIHAAAAVLVEADWLLPPKTASGPGRPREAYAINPRLWQALS
jgi:Protein of unknown function (DUF3987)